MLSNVNKPSVAKYECLLEKYPRNPESALAGQQILPSAIPLIDIQFYANMCSGIAVS